jgi:hypothetical protein
MTSIKNKKPEEYSDGSMTITTPAEIELLTDIDEENRCLNPHCDNTCSFSAHQLICVGGQVITTITPHCKTKVKCLNSGFGDPCHSGTPAPCSFKFYQNLCVEIDLTILANTKCNVDQVKCLGVSPGPCPK